MKQLLTEYTGYHVWANQTIISCLQQISTAQLHLTQASSFDSIRKTADHMADTEFNWLKRINGDSSWENKASLFGNDLSAMLQFWFTQSGQLATLVQACDEDRLKEVLVYKNLKGTTFKHELYRVVMHIVNHATYHRGQLVTLLRGAGVTELPNTDLIGFYRL